ncbi:MAG: DUF4118 domain-containing protein [Oscillospiraceae bacterium]
MYKISDTHPMKWQRLKHDILITVILVVTAMLLSSLLAEAFIDTMNVVMVYCLMVLIVARVTTGYVYGVVASIVGVLGVNYFFTYPYSALDFTKTGYPITFACMLGTSIVTSALTSRIKAQTERAQTREKNSEVLYEITKSLLCLREPEQIAQTSANYLDSFFECRAVIWLGDPTEGHAYYSSTLHLAQEDLSAATDAFVRGVETGRGTAFFPSAIGTYLPIMTQTPHGNVLGVSGLSREMTAFDEHLGGTLLNLITAQIAIALEYRHLERERQRAALEVETEKMRGNLLRAISHDLRTPLTGIYGASSALLEKGNLMAGEDCQSLLHDIQENAQWLIRMVENLLSVTRIGQSASNVSKTPEAAEEIIGAAVTNLRKSYPHAQIGVHAPDQLLMVPMDAILIQQVLINLIENAIKYANSNQPIQVAVEAHPCEAYFTVCDSGSGLPSDRISTIFEGGSVHSTVLGDSYRGMGIGLPICKTIVTAHGGRIGVTNRENGGCCFYFVLPL